MHAVSSTYSNAASLLVQNLWILVLITLVLQFPAMLLEGIKLSVPHHRPSPFLLPVHLLATVIFIVSQAAIYSVLKAGPLESKPWLHVIYSGATMNFWSLIRTNLNRAGLMFVIFFPLFAIASVAHLQLRSFAFVLVSLATLIAHAKLQVADAIVVDQKLRGQPAVKLAWQMTRGNAFRFVTVCLLPWFGLAVLIPNGANYAGTLSFIVANMSMAFVLMIQTIINWTVYLHLQEPRPDESAS